jgi:formamidopyrimidine-DNA glycosylase
LIELPEAASISRQIDEAVQGKVVISVTAAQTPHKLAWFYGDRGDYSNLIVGQKLGEAVYLGSLVEIAADNARILLGEGVNIRFHRRGEGRPTKHQLLLEFKDGSALSASVQMYGGMGIFKDGTLDNKYYRVAVEKPDPLGSDFDKAYFDKLLSFPGSEKLSLKALLATEQRIPGLGNGVLQDILFNARLHPKRKVSTLSATDRLALFESIKATLSSMAESRGRDTELDLFGQAGGYRTKMSKNTVSKPCRVCGTEITKETYMGGAVYFCPNCQPLQQ